MSGNAPGPMQAAQRLARQERPKRFYDKATAEPHEDGFVLKLDGRTARTPAKKPLAVADRRIAEAIATEWAAQGAEIDPATMPLTRIVNAAIDRVSGEMEPVRAEIVKYAGTDLLCYRAEGPAALVEAQNAAWEPILVWARDALGARFALAEGVVAIEQPQETLEAVRTALAGLDPLRLAAVHVITTLTGSAIIALAVLRGRLAPNAAWSAAHVDEDWQMSQWGRDEIALARRAARWREMAAAASILGAVPPGR
jgi:chaperone required for assembly of F1-ATPase